MVEDRIKVSVLMCVYNESSKFIRESVESVLEQTYNNFEFIIVCDNPENDHVVSLLKDYKQKDSRIILIINDTNIGLTRSLNVGLKQCQGKYIIRMDADDVSVHFRIEKQVRYMENHPAINACGSPAFVINESGKTVGKRKVPTNTRQASVQCVFSTPIIHPSSIIKRVIDNQPLCYDESMKYSQDFALWSSLPFGTISNISLPVLFYRETSSQITSKHREIQMECARRTQLNNLSRLGIELTDKEKSCYEALINGCDAGEIDKEVISHFLALFSECIIGKEYRSQLYAYISKCYVWYLFRQGNGLWETTSKLISFFCYSKGFSFKSVLLILLVYFTKR